ncbi:MAG: sugar phosphate isomerase/epimerase [Lachnospiraceae bacterium]|nr:sugar phosphate isomerase/epimerase [Lachnospiraceae bacterium]
MIELPVAAQVYSVRKEAEKDFEGTMERLARMGYEGVELVSLYGREPKELRACLDSLGLKAVSAHVPLGEFDRDLEGTVQAYEELGCSYLAIPWMDAGRRGDPGRFQETLDYFPVMRARCQKAGIQVCYHNHSYEFERTDTGEYWLDLLYRSVAPEDLAAQLDLCWVKVSGVDPVEYLKKYRGRCPIIHLKDFIRNKDHLDQMPLGEGEMDWKAIFSQLEDSQVQWLVVEQDEHPYGDSMENMKKSIDYIRKITKR